MSTQSNTSSQFLSLPQGGGALHGIGEKFSPDLHMGTGNFTVPIALPPGRSNFQPHLSLVYSTGNGNGAFGLGWSLSVPGVSRKTSKGVPQYRDHSVEPTDWDTFILSGAEDLVPIIDPDGTSHYRPRTEGLFARIAHHRDNQNDYWEVRSKDGLVSLYGTPGRSGAAPAVIADSAVIADPKNPGHVFVWKLSTTTDPFGNRIEYTYERDEKPTDGSHHWDQLYLSEIRYIDHSGKADQFLVSVKLNYKDRPDHVSDYRAGFEIRTVRRCSQIDVFTHADSDVLTRSYQFSYLDPLPQNGVSILQQIKVIGHDGSRSEELPPLEFGYTRFEPKKQHFLPITGPDLPPGSLAHPEYDLSNLFGNGLPDVLEMNGTVRYWRNLGQGRFDRPREMRAAPPVHLGDKGVQLLDADGDGRMDLLVTTETFSGYYPLRFDGLWDRRSFHPYRVAPSFDLKDPEVRLLDLDGDGVTDAMRSGSQLEYYFNDPQTGWGKTRRVERRALEDFPNVPFSDPRIKWADMTGDGLQDIVLVHDGLVEYWPNLGRGNWGKRISMHNAVHFPDGYDPRRILVGDVDGDGLADIVYVDDTKVTLWINQSGNGWSDPIPIQGTPPVSDVDAVRLADLLGAGVSGVLWSADAGGQSRQNMFFLDFTGGTKPYLLNAMDNHMGSVTQVDYAASTQFYLEDEKRPQTRWKTPLPFPVQVVARVVAEDALSGGRLTTDYSYHHGYWDGVEREFRGFGRVDQRDTEAFAGARFYSPPTETRTWFHQGAIGDEFAGWSETDFSPEFWPGDPQVLPLPQDYTDLLKSLPHPARRDALRALRGRVLRTELYALDGSDRQDRPYTVTESVAGVRQESPPSSAEGDRQRVFFPHVLAERTTQWERGNDPMARFTFTGSYDAYGQPGCQVSVAVPRGRDFRKSVAPGQPSEPYLITQTATDYARPDDAQVYIVDRVARTTTYEVPGDGRASPAEGSPPLLELVKAIQQGSVKRIVISQALNFYDGDAFLGLPFGHVGSYGALVRSEGLVLTPDILHEAYKGGAKVLTPPEEPPYLATGGTPPWDEYPQEFRQLLPALAGYTFQPGGTGSPYEAGYFAATDRRSYDFHADAGRKGWGLVKVHRDPLGRDSSIAYDSYDLLPTQVTDPAGLVTQAGYDYRVFQPAQITDPNGNQTAFTFTPLGLLATKAVRGKAGEGDQNRPSLELQYDFQAFLERGQPVRVRTLRYVHHDTETDVLQPERDETIETWEFSDGFGRLLQTRTQAEDVTFGDSPFGDAGLPAGQPKNGAAVGHQQATADPPRVVVSGWQNYDNKGRVVEKYEPFFSTGFNYALPRNAAEQNEFGEKVTMYYDPRGRLIRTVNPDSSEQRVVYGAPADLTKPDQFTPTPWEVFTYDANDNAGRTHPATSAGYQLHWNTPISTVVDALGRTVQTIERNGPNPATDWYVTRSAYDIRGNLLSARDPLDREAFRYVYDFANRALRTEALDGGIRRIVVDAAGNSLEQRDSKGALILHALDVLHRPVRLWARDGTGQRLTLREWVIHGDGADSGLTRAQARAANLLGKPYRHYDEAGRLTFEQYDFKGNILEKVRLVISDDQILSVFKPPPPDWNVPAFRVDWHPPPGSTLEDWGGKLLDPTPYQTSLTHDALNRAKTMLYPKDVDGARKELRPAYNRAGALERVELSGTVYVERIAYNAQGQRTLIVYGNGLMTRYAYDPTTFRLVRLRTEPYTQTGLTYRPAGDPLQDFAYEYDLAGNILTIKDRTPGGGVPNTPLGKDALDRSFIYDPLYRLLSATGRECDLPPPPPPWQDGPRCTDLTKTRAYTEQYQYDPAGNLTQLLHKANGGGFTRKLALAPNSNRLTTLTIGTNTYPYSYDAGGNLTQEATSRHFEWDHSDRMRIYRTQTDKQEPSIHTHYLYDSGGQRVKKLVRKQGGQVEGTVYIDGIFDHRRLGQQDNNALHVMDSQHRIALVRVGPPLGDVGPAVEYHLGDHLDNSIVVVDATAGFVNREEYTPYGETSFGSFARKRYRFTGKEREEASGLYYHGARYYAPWLARWMSCDPAGMADGTNLYAYTRSNPLGFKDPTGKQGLETVVAAGGELLVSGGAATTTTITTAGTLGASGATVTGAAGATTATVAGAPGATAATTVGATTAPGAMGALTVLGTVALGALASVMMWAEFKGAYDYWTGKYELPSDRASIPMSLPDYSGGLRRIRLPPADPHATAREAPGYNPVHSIGAPGIDTGNTKLEAGRPSTARKEEHAYWGYYWDPFSNDIKFTKEIMAADHIYSAHLITQLPGFDKLKPTEKDAILNYEGNFQPLPRNLNSSKWIRTADKWISAEGQAFNADYVRDAIKLEKQIKGELQATIDNYIKH
jgi:RHS repeat-associated protein